MWKFTAGLVFALLMFAIVFGFVAWGQKTEEATAGNGVTLAALGVTAEQKAQIKALWELKRHEQIQAVENLRTLNRLARDMMAPDDDIQETLKQFREKRLEQEKKIKAAEAELIKVLPPRAQLHLTILGVLDNGLPPRFGNGSKSKTDAGQK